MCIKYQLRLETVCDDCNELHGQTVCLNRPQGSRIENKTHSSHSTEKRAKEHNFSKYK